MKKVMLLIILILLQVSLIKAQDLTEVYKTGKIAIQPDSDFGKDNWFENKKNNLRRYTNIVLSENGDVFLLDRKEYQVLKFDKNGKHIKIIDLNATKSTSVYHQVNQVDILDNKYLLIRRYSNIKIFDLNGQFIKTIKFDYPLFGLVALKNDKICVKGQVYLKNRITKIHVALVGIENESEKHVTTFFRDKNKESMSVKYNGGSISTSSPQRAPRIFISRTLDGNLIVGNSKESDISIYNTEGKLLHKINLNFSPLMVEQGVKDKIQKNFEKYLKKHNAPDSLLEAIKSPDFYYQNMPYYYGIKVDSENNILVFKHTKDKNHTFRVYQVYSKEGKFICETTLEPGEFENPSLRLTTFSNGYLYALMKSKGIFSKLKLVKAELKPAL